MRVLCTKCNPIAQHWMLVLVSGRTWNVYPESSITSPQVTLSPFWYSTFHEPVYGEPIVLRGSERVDFVEQSYQVGTCSACMDPHSVDGVPPCVLVLLWYWCLVIDVSIFKICVFTSRTLISNKKSSSKNKYFNNLSYFLIISWKIHVSRWQIIDLVFWWW